MSASTAYRLGGLAFGLTVPLLPFRLLTGLARAPRDACPVPPARVSATA